MQATDRWIGVRGARIVVCDDTEVRAICAAHWLKQMGWEVYVLGGGIGDAGLESGDLPEPEFLSPTIDAPSLLRLVFEDAVFILDLRDSKAFENSHIEGAQWVVRPQLSELFIPKNKEVILISDDQVTASLVAGDLANRSIRQVRLLDGGMVAWQKAGGRVVETVQNIVPSARIDFVAFTAERHDGNKDHMRQYLEWEINLVNQLDDQERSAFKIMTP